MDAARADWSRRLWLRLFFAPGVGGATVARLLGKFATVESLFEAREEAFDSWGEARGVFAAIHGQRLDLQVDRLLEEISRWPDARIVTPTCAEYPPRLIGSGMVPAVLFVRGQLQNPSPSAAVVGSRNARPDRAALTREWCCHLAQRGVSIVSGLAEGIDAAAHEGALQAEGHTVAVLGTGLARTYPSHHAALLDRILASGGAVVSQFEPYARTQPGFFPARNATIAGMADAVVVMQAGVRSGALYTADEAKRFGRTVLAMPSHPSDPTNGGCLRLLKRTACALSSPEDVARALHLKDAKYPDRPLPSLPPQDRRVLDELDFVSVGLDELTRKLEQPAAWVLECLLRLELAGLVARQPGPRYVRIR